MKFLTLSTLGPGVGTVFRFSHLAIDKILHSVQSLQVSSVHFFYHLCFVCFVVLFVFGFCCFLFIVLRCLFYCFILLVIHCFLPS